MDEISIYQYLNRDEAKELVSRLNGVGIKAHSGIMTSGEGDLDIYQVYIGKGDLSKAAPIVDRYKKLLRSKQVVEKFTCPRCKARTPYVEIAEKPHS